MKKVLMVAVSLLVLALVGLAAILILSPAESPRGQHLTNPRIDQDSFVMADGVHLPLRSWGTESSSNTGDGTQTVVLALHGASPNFGSWPGTQSLIDDMNDVIAVLRHQCPTARLYIAGQSLGAAVILNAAARGDLPDVDGVILISPAFNARRTVSRGLQLLAAVGARIAPSRSIPRPPDSITGVSNNEGYKRALIEDPLYMKQFTFGLAYGALSITDDAMEGAEKLSAPTLLLYGQHDVVVDEADIREASRRVSAEKQVIVYPDGYQALVVDDQRENVFSDVATWIDPE